MNETTAENLFELVRFLSAQFGVDVVAYGSSTVFYLNKYDPVGKVFYEKGEVNFYVSSAFSYLLNNDEVE